MKLLLGSIRRIALRSLCYNGGIPTQGDLGRPVLGTFSKPNLAFEIKDGIMGRLNGENLPNVVTDLF
jgi:hypothetical protein